MSIHFLVIDGIFISVGGCRRFAVDKLLAKSYHLFFIFSSPIVSINSINSLIPLSIVESILCLLNVIIDVFNALIVVDRSCTGAACAGAACTGSPSEFTHFNQLAI